MVKVRAYANVIGICQRQKEDIYCRNPGRRSPVRRSLEQVCAVAGYGLNPA